MNTITLILFTILFFGAFCYHHKLYYIFYYYIQ